MFQRAETNLEHILIFKISVPISGGGRVGLELRDTVHKISGIF